MFFISFVVIDCEMYSQFSNEFKNANIRAKRLVVTALTQKLEDQINKENQREQLENVTSLYKDPRDPDSYGR
uniref:Uncharacterized protein n=1 Tax=Strongyloides venezuelensis TaxID=75913 RepID=A0A0K0FSN6_STRVS